MRARVSRAPGGLVLQPPAARKRRAPAGGSCGAAGRCASSRYGTRERCASSLYGAGERCASSLYGAGERCASGLDGAGERCASGLYPAGERCASGLYAAGERCASGLYAGGWEGAPDRHVDVGVAELVQDPPGVHRILLRAQLSACFVRSSQSHRCRRGPWASREGRGGEAKDGGRPGAAAPPPPPSLPY